MHFSVKRAFLKARFFFIFVCLASILAAQEDEGVSVRGEEVTVQLWQEFQKTYSERSLAKMKPAAIEAAAFAIFKKSPNYRLHQASLEKLDFLPAVVKLGQLRKRSPFDELEDLLADFCEVQLPFEAYLSAHDRNLEEEAARGERAGAGMQLNRDAVGRYSLSPFENSPAEKAGVQDDDELLEVEGRSAKKMSIPEIKALVLGPPDSELTIRVSRRSGGEKIIRIRRAKHHEPLARLKKTITGQILSIRSFNRGVYKSVKTCLGSAGELNRLTIDLRGNGGGDLEEAVKVASLFLPDGATIYQQRSRDGETRVVRDSDGIQHTTKSLRLLVDRHTASAGELVTAALLAQAGVSLQGEKTYGKSVITTRIPLLHGGYLTIQTQQMLGPNGVAWEDGIDPARWAAGEKPY